MDRGLTLKWLETFLLDWSWNLRKSVPGAFGSPMELPEMGGIVACRDLVPL